MLVVAELPAVRLVEEDWAEQMMGGCTFTETYDGPRVPVGRLLVSATMADASGTWLVQERGRFAMLDASQAAAALQIPAGYTPE